MTPSSPLDRPTSGPAAGSVSGIGRSAPPKSAGADGGGPAFRALLDKLHEQARTLSEDSESVARPEDLSGAVDRARATLDDALSLSDRLLEAYREATQQGGDASSGGAR